MIALRPLSFGELFDRAIAIGVRNARTLAVVAFVPLFLAIWADVSVVMRLEPLRQMWTGHHHFATVGPAPVERFVCLLLFSIASTFVAAMIARSMAHPRQGDRIDARAGWSATSRWSSLLGIALALFVLALPESLALSRHATAMWLLWLPIESWLMVPVTLAACAVAVEGLGARGAIATSFRRATGIGLRRSLVLAAGLLAFDLVRAIVELVIAGLAMSQRVDWTIVPMSAVIDTVAEVFIILVICVYYFDLRVRRDGYGIA